MMVKLHNKLKAVVVILLAIACCTLAVVWPQWQQELQAQNYELEVTVDIKPGSCPNPLNVNALGILTVALVGTETFDVTQVDPETVRLEGIAPVRWSIKDVATPYQPCMGNDDIHDRREVKRDKNDDLVLQFNVLDIFVGALGDVQDGDAFVLQMTGNLKQEFGGYPFIGEDVVRIIRKK